MANASPRINTPPATEIRFSDRTQFTGKITRRPNCPKLSERTSSSSTDSLGTQDQDGFCSRCSAMDIGGLLDTNLDVPEHGLQILALGKPNTAAFRKGCHLCDLLLSVATTYKRNYEVELRLFNHVPGMKYASVVRTAGAQNRFIAVVRQNERLVYDSRVAHEIGPNGVLVVERRNAPESCPVRVVDPKSIDYDTVKYWLDQCTKTHTSICGLGSQKSPSEIRLRVLDCHENVVALLPQEEEYVALSYVWGTTVSNPTASEVSANGHVTFDNIPRSIRDAMKVVRDVGRRYLWVDRYCVPHANVTARAQAILNMHQIYAGAALTIVVLYGNNANTGIPGVSEVKRTGIQRVETPKGNLNSSLLPLKTAITMSAWSKRGWTFQEARLSRRCLFLSEQQAYYSCRMHTLSESLPSSWLSCSLAKHLHPSGLEPSMFAPGSNLMFSGIFLDRLSYSQRTLTHQDDALDAFRGVLRIHPFVTYWGMPVAHERWTINPTLCFTMGLLWARGSLATFEAHMPDTHSRSYGRRPGFPTWSWASVIGEVFQFGTNEDCVYRTFFRDESTMRPQEMESAITVIIKDSGESLDEAVRSVAAATTNMLPETSPSLIIKGDIIRVRRERNDSIKPGKVGHIRYRFCDKNDQITSDVYILPRIDLDEDDVDTTEAQDALVLIQWRDGCHRGQRRFILMLLKWVGDSVAERVGLLGRHYEKWNVSFLDRLHRRNVEFELR